MNLEVKSERIHDLFEALFKSYIHLKYALQSNTITISKTSKIREHIQNKIKDFDSIHH